MQIIVVGGGAAGLMAAGTAARYAGASETCFAVKRRSKCLKGTQRLVHFFFSDIYEPMISIIFTLSFILCRKPASNRCIPESFPIFQYLFLHIYILQKRQKKPFFGENISLQKALSDFAAGGAACFSVHSTENSQRRLPPS